MSLIDDINYTDSTSTPSESDINLEQPRKKVKKGGPQFDEVWSFVIMGEKMNPGHYKATCYHCGKVWPRGKPEI